MAESRSRTAFNELLESLRDAAEHVEKTAAVTGADTDDLAEGYRNLTHILQSGLFAHQEADPHRPVFSRIVSPTRSFTGDNADAIYYETSIAGGGEYTIRGNIAGAVYTSFTLEAGGLDGSYPTATAGVLRDTDIEIDADGNYEIRLGGTPAPRGWLAIPAMGGRITTRHYFEWPVPAAASQTLHIPLSIESATPPSSVLARARWDDSLVSAAIGRVTAHVRGKTTANPAARRVTATPGAPQPPEPAFVSRVANTFPKPVVPGNLALSAFDAAYSLAPYAIARDEALVITGRWPPCRFANVCLWNRWSQMFDYVQRNVSRNRANTVLEPDGSFRMVVAHHDPGVPNWLDTEGRTTGTMFWRFFLPEGEIETPIATVVPFALLR